VSHFCTSVWDYDSIGSHDLIGECLVTVDELCRQQVKELINEEKKVRRAGKGKPYSNSGTINFGAILHRDYSFLDYLGGGCEVFADMISLAKMCKHLTTKIPEEKRIYDRHMVYFIVLFPPPSRSFLAGFVDDGRRLHRQQRRPTRPTFVAFNEQPAGQPVSAGPFSFSFSLPHPGL
jgi:hypothetical protein